MFDAGKIVSVERLFRDDHDIGGLCKNGHKLGVFASSDHISQHTAFGGVYVEKFTREGIIEALNARRTVAGTDKIFLEFSCNGKPLGSIFESTTLPRLEISVSGTALQGFLDGAPILEYTLAEPVSGKVGLWSKTDSVTVFDDFTVTPK